MKSKNFESKAVEQRFNKEQFTDEEKQSFRTSKSLQSRTDKRISYVIENGISKIQVVNATLMIFNLFVYKYV